jgi:small subunit ribosomal protein S16
MPAKIRLQRHGKKGQPFYHIVVADGRAPRDGRFIEKIGTYNPLTNPATIVLDFNRAYYWVNCGVQPSDTVRSLLRREGIYMKKHLMGGVQKGAFDEAEAEKRFEAWKNDKQNKINNLKLEVLNTTKAEAKKRFEHENKLRQAQETLVNEKRMAEIEKTRKAKEEAEAIAAAKQQAEAPVAEVVENTENVETEAPQEMTE